MESAEISKEIPIKVNLQDKQSFQCDNTFDREADLRTHVTTHTESLACSECENKSHC